MIFLNGDEIEFGKYPNGETAIDGEQFTKYRYAKDVNLTLRWESDEDLIHLLLVRHHLDSFHFGHVHLHIRYMPYSRMDRTDGVSVFTLKTVSEFINSMQFDDVRIDEPHSDVTCALVDRSFAMYPTISLLPQVRNMIGWYPRTDYLFFPDAGAQKRYSKVLGHNTAVGFKHRDFTTGELTGEMDVVGFNQDEDECKVLIVDDLCSRGGTFVMAAKELRSLGATKVYLFVAHCENSVWDGDLLSSIDGLYCTDSIFDTSVLPSQGDWQRNSKFGPPFNKIHVYENGKWL